MFGKKQKKAKNKGLGSKIKEIFNKDSLTDSFYEDLEELLLTADMGVSLTMEIIDQLREAMKKRKNADLNELTSELKAILSQEIKTVSLQPEPNRLNLFLVLGVNGVGKTTSIAKMALYFKKNQLCEEIVFAAADTFRAAAIDQLKLHGSRLNIPVVAHQPNSDPAAVVYDAIQSAIARKKDLVIVDTAGRLHNKSHLVEELQKIARIIEKQSDSAVVKKILVIDATTGQNGINQAEIFNEAVGIDAVVMAKYDSMAKGGIAINISRRLGIPVAFVGVGEKMEDFKPFDKKEFIERIMNE